MTTGATYQNYYSSRWYCVVPAAMLVPVWTVTMGVLFLLVMVMMPTTMRPDSSWVYPPRCRMVDA
jgi:hypothetical protein